MTKYIKNTSVKIDKGSYYNHKTINIVGRGSWIYINLQLLMVKSKKAEVDETKVAAEKNTTKKPAKVKAVENYDLPTWDILDAFFMQGGDTDCTNNIVRHQIESFNEFIDKQLIQIIQGFNPIQVCHNYNQEIGNFKYKIFLNILIFN